MSKVLVTKAKVDTIADKITALVDDTSKKTLDEMATSLNGVGLEVAEQEDLIAQIKSTVDSLPEAGGGEDEPSGPTPEVCNINFMPSGPVVPGEELTIYYLDANMQFQTVTTEMGEGMIRCVKNSIVYVKGAGMMVELSEGLIEINYIQLT